MAVTSIWRVKGWLGKVVLYIENPEKTKEPDFYLSEDMTDQERGSLADVIAYAVDEEKTRWGDQSSETLDDESEPILQQYVSGINCATSTARMEMMAVKKRFGKEDGVVAYHGYQSFAPGECTPAMVHEIGVRLAKELWGERYQVLIATHLDKTNHLHNHFVVNTVSFLDGRKYHRTKQDYRDMRRVSDRLCREYGLSVVRQPERGRGKSYGEWRAERDDRPTYAGMMRADVDEAIRKARTEKQFFYYLREKGYTFKFGKDITLRAAGRDRGLKMARNFGENYTIDSIRARILQEKPSQQESRGGKYYGSADSADRNPVTILRVYVGARPKRKIGGLRGLYLHYCYLLGILPKRRSPVQPEQVHVLLREELLKLHIIAEETRLLCHYKIETAEQLFQFQEEMEQEQNGLIDQRRHLQYQCRSICNSERMAQVKGEIKELTGKIGENRRKLKLCQGIAERSGLMKEKLWFVYQEKGEKEEVRSHEYIGRGG